MLGAGLYHADPHPGNLLRTPDGRLAYVDFGMMGYVGAGLSAALASALYAHQLRLPPYFALLLRSLAVLEGIALATDPRYQILAAAYPWVARRLLQAEAPRLKALLSQVLYSRGELDFARLQSLLSHAVVDRERA
ncbi:hypothetical protein H632_c3983p0, partial [Helicosporidium sp. ATCC 50920]